MSWTQVTTPNFDPVIYQGEPLRNWVGWCMAYVEQSVDQMYVYDNAMEGWSKVKGRHADKNVPKGVWVPLWYRGWVYNGVEQGHVLWAKLNSDGSGTAYTSPNDAKASADKITFKSLDDLTRQLQEGWASDISYRGWSEYVGDEQIIKYEKEPKMEKTALRRLVRAMLNRDATKEDESKYLGKDPNQVIMSIDNWARKNGRTYQQTLDRASNEISTLKISSATPVSTASTKATTLKPGIYEVK